MQREKDLQGKVPGDKALGMDWVTPGVYVFSLLKGGSLFGAAERDG